MSKKCPEKADDSGAEAVETSMKTLLELFVEQQRAQQEQQREQQRILLALVEQQKEELAQQRRDMAEFRRRQGAHEKERTATRLPKPTL